MKKAALSLSIFLCLLPSVAAAFDLDLVRPQSPYGGFFAYSAETIPKGDFAVGYSLERSQKPDFYRQVVGGAYGLGNRADLTLDAGFVNGYHGQGGFEDIGAAFKYRLLDEGRYAPAVAAMAFGYAPTGRDTVSWGGGVGGGVALTRTLGPLTANLDAIITNPGQSGLHNEFDFLGSLGFPIAHGATILSEFQVRKEAYSGRVDLSEVRFGYRIMSDKLYSALGLGFGLKERHPQFRLIISVGALLGKPGIMQ